MSKLHGFTTPAVLLAAAATLAATAAGARPTKVNLSTSTFETFDPDGGLPFEGDTLYHQLDIRNTGNTAAMGITVDVELSPGVQFRSIAALPTGVGVKYGAGRTGGLLARFVGLAVPAGEARRIVLEVEATGQSLTPMRIDFPNPATIARLTGGHDPSEFTAFHLSSRAFLTGLNFTPVGLQNDFPIITGVVLADIEVGLREFGDAPFITAAGTYAFYPIVHCQTSDPPRIYTQADELPLLGATFTTETSMVLYDSVTSPDADGCANVDINGVGERDRGEDGVSVGACDPTRTCMGPGTCTGLGAVCLRVDAFVPTDPLYPLRCAFPAGQWLNVLMDTDQSGHWNPDSTVSPACSDEWLVRDYPITTTGVVRLQSKISSIGLLPSAADNSFRLRVILSGETMRSRALSLNPSRTCFDGYAGFQSLLCGETEDYRLRKVGTTFTLDAPVACP